MNNTQKWLDKYHSQLKENKIDNTEAVSLIQEFITKSIKQFDFDDLEYLLDNIDMDITPYKVLSTIINKLSPYSSEFEFWEEFVADVKKRK